MNEYIRIIGICFNIGGLLIIGLCDMKRTNIQPMNIYPMVTAFLFSVCNLWLFAGPAITRLFSR